MSTNAATPAKRPFSVSDILARTIRNTSKKKLPHLLHFLLLMTLITVLTAFMQHHFFVANAKNDSFTTYLYQIPHHVSAHGIGSLATAFFVGITTSFGLLILIMDWAYRPIETLDHKGNSVLETFHQPEYIAYLSNHAGPILTSFGILGTFVGLALGTANSNLESHELHRMLLSLSVAFWSSVFGLLWALIIRLAKGIFNRRAEQVDDVVTALHLLDERTGIESENIQTTIQNASALPSKKLARAVRVELQRTMSDLQNNFSHELTLIRKTAEQCEREARRSQEAQAETMVEGMLEASALLQTTIDDLGKNLLAINKDTRALAQHMMQESATHHAQTDQLFTKLHQQSERVMTRIAGAQLNMTAYTKEMGDTVEQMKEYAEKFKHSAETSKEWGRALDDLSETTPHIRAFVSYLTQTLKKQNRTLAKIAKTKTRDSSPYDPSNLGNLMMSLRYVGNQLDRFICLHTKTQRMQEDKK